MSFHVLRRPLGELEPVGAPRLALATSPVTDAPEPLISSEARGNLVLFGLVGGIALGTGWLVSRGRKRSTTPLQSVGAAVLAAGAGLAGGVAGGYAGIRLSGTNDWGALGYLIIGGIAGAGVSSGATYALLTRRG